MTIARANNKTAPIYIAAQKEFNGSSISGRLKTKRSVLSTGRLPQEFVSEILSDINAMEDNAAIYFVYSYTTVIAWWTQANGWKKPMVNYAGDSGKPSTTTKRHQRMIPPCTELALTV